MQTLKDLSSLHAREYTTKPAFIGANLSCTFRALNDLINRLNNGLALLGVRKGDRVDILAYNCP